MTNKQEKKSGAQSCAETQSQTDPNGNSTYRDPISRKTWIALAIIAAASLLAHLALLPSMPAEIPIHWDANGNVNGWGSPGTQVLLSALPLLMLGMFYATPRMDPSGRNYERFGGLWRCFVIAMTLFLIAASWMTELTVFGILPQNGNPVGAFVMGLLGIGLIVLANYTPRVRHNYTFGCKTPWALANLENWRLTHRFAGRLLLVAGLCMIASGVLSWLSTTKALGVDLSDATLALTLIPLFASLIAIFAYSYLVFRNGNKPLRKR